jgi:hypothetical protein
LKGTRKFYQEKNMIRKSTLLVIALFLVGFCVSGAWAQPAEPSLPDHLKIEPPAAGVSPRVAQLSGIWEGTWDYLAPLGGGGGQKSFRMDEVGRGVKIAIVKIAPPNVKAIYARPGKTFPVKEASVEGESIVLRFGQPGEKKTVTLSPSGNPQVANATMTAEHKGRPLKATLRKK